MRRIVFHVEAEIEVDAAFNWYWKQSPDAAVGFLDELAAIQAQIRRNPRQFSMVARPLRRAVLKRYPYSLLFRDSEDSILVLAVAHGKHRFGYWKDRE